MIRVQYKVIFKVELFLIQRFPSPRLVVKAKKPSLPDNLLISGREKKWIHAFSQKQ